jgi:hypothetical protein
MRMWMVDPEIMCSKHLTGEHLELHMFVGAIRKGTSMQGYVDSRLLEPLALEARHKQLVDELLARGGSHKSEMGFVNLKGLPRKIVEAKVDRKEQLDELLSRCPACAKRYADKQERIRREAEHESANL